HLDVSGKLRLNLQGDLARQRFASQQLALDITLDGSRLPGGSRSFTLATPLTVDLSAQTLALPALVAKGEGIDLRARVAGQRIVDKPAFSGEIELAQLSLRQLLEDLAVELPAMADDRTLRRFALKGSFAASGERVDLTGV